MRTRTILVASSFTLMGCSALIGVRDIYLDENAAQGSLDGSASSSSSSSSSSSGGAGDGATDAPIQCNAPLDSDPANCGRCGHDCLGGGCEGGKCKPATVFTTDSPRYVQANATEIIFTDDKVDAVRAIDKATKNVRTICAMPTGSGVDELVIDATNAYFTFRNEADGADIGGIAQCTLATTNGTPSIVAPGQSYPGSLVIDGTTLYWTQGLDPRPIMRLSGKVVSQIATGDPGAEVTLGVFGGFLYVANDTSNGTLKRCPTSAPCSLVTIATDPDGIDAVMQIGENLLWGEGVYPATIYEGLPDGGQKNAVTGSGEIAHSFAYDDGSFLWLNSGVKNSNTGDYDQGWVGRCPQSGGIVSCGTGGPENLTGKTMLFVRGLVRDDVAFYWVDNSTNGGIWRLAR